MKKLKLVFYDVTETDKEQILSHLDKQKYDIELITDSLSQDTIVSDADVISVFVSSIVTKDDLDKLPNLKLIACRSTGFNNVDLETAFARNVAVVNVPTYGSSTVAEYAFALLLSLTRKLVDVVHYTKKGQLEHEQFRGFDLAGKTLGIVGTGKIGLNVAQIAKGFGMKLRGFDPYPNEDRAKELGITYSGLAELVEYSDFITLHAPYTQENHHLINSSILGKCKNGAFIINTARGELIDSRALVKALQSGSIAGAGLDVVEGESLLDREAEISLVNADRVDQSDLQHSIELTSLLKMPNVIVTKHNAFNTFEAVSRINETTIENINNYFAGELTNVVGDKSKKGQLVMVRHTESEWNAAGLWTGTRNVHLTTKGKNEAKQLGQVLNDLQFDKVFVSEQVRTHETADILLETIDHNSSTYTVASGLNERDYGVMTGKNKWQMREQLGEDEFQAVRRGWDHPIENGESLKQVYERSVPFYKEQIVPLVNSGESVLVVAHGNSLRSLIKYIESLTDEEIENTEMIFNSALIYTIDEVGRMQNKQIRTIDSVPPPV